MHLTAIKDAGGPQVVPEMPQRRVQISTAETELQVKEQLREASFTSKSSPEDAPSRDELEKIVQEMRKFRGWGNFLIDFTIDEESDSTVIKIIDRDSGEVLRQIPPEEILQLKRHMVEVLGMLFDNKA